MLAIIALSHLRTARQKRALRLFSIGNFVHLITNKSHLKLPLSLAQSRPSMIPEVSAISAYSVCYAVMWLLTLSLLIDQLIDHLFTLAFLGILSGLTLSLLALSRFHALIFDPSLKLETWFKSAASWYLGKVASFKAATYGCRAPFMTAVVIKEKMV